MRVPGHVATCRCRWCLDGNQYALLRSGTYFNVTQYVPGKDPTADVPPPPKIQELPEKLDSQEPPCPPVEYRRGKPVVPKGRRRRR